MAHSSVPDGGTRFPELLSVRLPLGFTAKIRAAAEAEGISPRDFTRRAIADRIDKGATQRTGNADAQTIRETGTPEPSAPASPAPLPPPAASSPAVATSPAPTPAPAADAPAPRDRSSRAWTQP